MNAAEQAREEEHFRKVEGAMLFIEDAARRAQRDGQRAEEGRRGILWSPRWRLPPAPLGLITRA